MTATAKENWGSRLGVVLAMAGNAIGFGNFLRFPVQAVSNGGGAFIIPYIVCFILLGIPLTFIEWTIGRYSGQFNCHSTPAIMGKAGKKRIWLYAGIFGIFSNLAIASYYCYIESWTLSYVYHSIVGTFHGMSQSQVAHFFTNYHDRNTPINGIPMENVVAFILCLALNVWILNKGLKGGIEKVAKWGVPLLLLLGIFLAIKGICIRPGEHGAVAAGLEGLNFLWTPQYSTLADPKVWLAAAGQIFFTLSVGMGCIQCYASFLREDEDIVLGSLTTGFLNEFVEIVLGGTIIVSIAVGFFGLDGLKSMIANEGGFGIAFQSMPYLFQKWGPFIGTLCGIAFFGLLFIAGITSSLAMSTPMMSFLEDQFHLKKKNAALTVGLSILICGLPTVLFFKEGVFDEYDYWAGTVALFIFALLEAVLFAWVFGIDNSWKELNRAADIKIPKFFKFILHYITPSLLILILLAAFFKPENDDWSKLSLKGWPVDQTSILGKLMNKNAGPNHTWFADTLYAEIDGVCLGTQSNANPDYLNFDCVNAQGKSIGYVKAYKMPKSALLLVPKGTFVKAGTPIIQGHVINNCFYISLTRYFLLALFLFVLILIRIAFNKSDYFTKTHKP